MNEQAQQPHVYSDEEIRAAVNQPNPLEAIEMTLSLVQRIALALESIAQSMQEPPTVLFEQAPTNDGLGLMDLEARTGEKEH